MSKFSARFLSVITTLALTLIAGATTASASPTSTTASVQDDRCFVVIVRGSNVYVVEIPCD